ncbi:MAG: hypothetical protein KJ941_02155 [Bacteroidetes bacterium]|nr:hypothetical protein [Bacteroidota bacterium]
MFAKIVRFLIIAILVQVAIYILAKIIAPQLIHINLLFGFTIAIIFIGALVLFLNAKQDEFVGRFMIVTTFQMIAALSIILAFSYKKTVDALPHALWLLAFFLSHLVYQSIYLVQQNKTEDVPKSDS